MKLSKAIPVELKLKNFFFFFEKTRNFNLLQKLRNVLETETSLSSFYTRNRLRRFQFEKREAKDSRRCLHGQKRNEASSLHNTNNDLRTHAFIYIFLAQATLTRKQRRGHSLSNFSSKTLKTDLVTGANAAKIRIRK